ncbi:glycophorin-C [Menidia menidia]
MAAPSRSPWVQTSAHTHSPFSDLVTRIGSSDVYSDAGDFAALIGGIVSVVLLLFICTVAVLLWCLSRQKGSYTTNEADGEPHDGEPDGEPDTDSIGSEAVLQSRELLQPGEDH